MKYIILLLAIFSFGSHATEIEVALASSGLIKKEIPKDDEWLKSNNAHFEICLHIDDKKEVVADLKEECKKDPLVVNFMGKTFTGTNNGEFGGNFSVKLQDGSKRILIEDNVVQMVATKNDLYVFTGLSHMLTDRGAVYKVVQKDGIPFAERITLLPGAPEIVVSPDGNRHSFFIVTSGGLVEFNPEEDVLSSLLIDQFWGGLYPTTAIFKDNQLAIGMRSGVALIDFSFPTGVEKVQYFTKQSRKK